MKHLLFILSTFFAFYGFACLNASETTLNNEIVNQLSTDAGLNFQSDDHQPEQVNEEEGISNGAEKPKKKKVIKIRVVWRSSTIFMPASLIIVF